MRSRGWILGAVILAAWTAGPVRAQNGAGPALLDLGTLPPVQQAASGASLGAPSPKEPTATQAIPAAKDASARQATADAKEVGAAKLAAAKETPGESPLAGIVDPNVVQASCASCGSGLLRGDGPGCASPGCASIGCNGCNCVPGRTHCCSICDSDTCAGHILCGLYECICCPDHCYEPEYIPAANASFFVDSARPVTQTRLRYDGMFDITNADRAEYYFAHFMTKNLPANPACSSAAAPGKGPAYIPSSVDINQISLYQEAAAGRFSGFVSIPYDHIDPAASPASAVLGQTVCPSSGFADMTLGTKSLLLDCDLLQVALQFSTFLPIGNFGQGLGTAHVSLEPALLFTLKLTPDCYFQGEMAYWIPIAGDPLFEGPVWHNRFSFNQVLCRILPDVQLIGTLECINYNVLGGNYTSPNLVLGGNTPVAVSGTATMFSAGPGVRLDVCKRFDCGVGSQFNFTGSHFANEEVRVDLRLRF